MLLPFSATVMVVLLTAGRVFSVTGIVFFSYATVAGPTCTPLPNSSGRDRAAPRYTPGVGLPCPRREDHLPSSHRMGKPYCDSGETANVIAFTVGYARGEFHLSNCSNHSVPQSISKFSKNQSPQLEGNGSINRIVGSMSAALESADPVSRAISKISSSSNSLPWSHQRQPPACAPKLLRRKYM